VIKLLSCNGIPKSEQALQQKQSLILKTPKIIDRLAFEKVLWKENHQRIMGLDEVGRGCLAGPVVASGVIFRAETPLNEAIRDSKQIPVAERKALAEWIKEHALFWTIQEASEKEIDQINILQASMLAMLRCVEQANENGYDPDHLLVDGNRFTAGSLIPYTCLVKGDDRSMSIGAASILAKVARDEYMENLHNKWPEYDWKNNVGYPSPKHKAAVREFGITEHHRLSFKLENRELRKR
jgi:ribonuclease HII